MRKILIMSERHGSKEILVDDEDYEWLSSFNWYIVNHKHTFYARVHQTIDGKHTKVYMHRMILGLKGRHEIGDHKDGNGLNNQRNNIRKCTQSQNQKNRKPRKSGTGYLGVGKTENGFRAFIMLDKVYRHLGHFKDPIEAAKVYDKAAIEHHGEFARPNFPQ